jgi:ribosome-associated protein
MQNLGPCLRGDDAFQRTEIGGLNSTPHNENQGYNMQKTTFELTSEFIELNQLLKLTGVVDSGGAGKHVVASGAVSVDGKKELRKTAKIRAGQVVTLGDIRIDVR